MVSCKQLRAIPADLLALTEYHLADRPAGDRQEASSIDTQPSGLTVSDIQRQFIGK